MRTVVIGERPPEIDQWVERRRQLGQDLFDEVWEGDYHVALAPHRGHGDVEFQLARLLGPRADVSGLRGSGPCNIGGPDDYRVPDQAFFRNTPPAMFHQTAAVVVEIVSPRDESRRKLDFYHRLGVEEVLLVDPALKTVEWFVRQEFGFDAAVGSAALAISADELALAIEWP